MVGAGGGQFEQPGRRTGSRPCHHTITSGPGGAAPQPPAAGRRDSRRNGRAGDLEKPQAALPAGMNNPGSLVRSVPFPRAQPRGRAGAGERGSARRGSAGGARATRPPRRPRMRSAVGRGRARRSPWSRRRRGRRSRM